jgi:PAS domain S-box-containing protein
MPVEDAPQTTASNPAATILIVDDQAFDRKLLETLLTGEGYRTASSDGGDDLAGLITATSPDLILVDFQMPGVGGCQIVWTLKTDPATAQVPIIMVTGHDDAQARLAGLLAGAEEFLTKPIDRSELVLRVRNLLRLKAHTDLAENQTAVLEETVRARTADLHRFRMALDTTGDGIFLVNRATMRFVDSNSTARVLLGYTREELLGIGPAQISTATPQEWERVYDAVIARHPSDELTEVELVRKDGTRFVVEARRQAYRAGSDWLIDSVMRDITERKKAEDALKLSEFSVNIASVSTYWIAADARILRVN